GIIERFGHKAPLYGKLIAPVNGEGFIIAPAYAAMINDDIIDGGSAKSVIAAAAVDHAFVLVLIAHSEVHIPNDHIITTDDHGKIGHTNTVARRCLPGKRSIAPDV